MPQSMLEGNEFAHEQAQMFDFHPQLFGGMQATRQVSTCSSRAHGAPVQNGL
jgi:hypothetical protein